MRREMIEKSAYELATQVREVEDVIDAALAELAELQSRLVRTVGVTGIAHVRAQNAFDQLAATTSNLIAARGTIGNCHVAMAEAKQFVPGLRTVGFGDADECPKFASNDLRIVA